MINLNFKTESVESFISRGGKKKTIPPIINSNEGLTVDFSRSASLGVFMNETEDILIHIVDHLRVAKTNTNRNKRKNKGR